MTESLTQKPKNFLSREEKEIKDLVASGMKNKQVADEIGTNEYKVKKLLRKVFDKLGVWNRGELAVMEVDKKNDSVNDEKLNSYITTDETRRIDELKLGPRRRQILKLLITGADNKQIAAELKMALRTVKTHLNKLYLGIGITKGNKKVQLTIIAIKHPELWKDDNKDDDAAKHQNTAA